MKRVTIKHFLNKSTKRVQILSLCLVLVIGVIGFAYYVSVVNGDSVRAFSGQGKGSEDDPFQITSCIQLQQSGREAENNYILMNDIDCSDTINWNNGAGFEPIHSEYINFDGRNFTIKDMYINRPNELNVGIFDLRNSRSTIRNLRLEKSPSIVNRIDINGARNVGAVSGHFTGSATNISSSLNVQANGAADGFDGAEMNAGGVFGKFTGAANLIMSSGNVTIASNDQAGRSASIGGLVGRYTIEDPNNNWERQINDSYATGSVSAGSGAFTPASDCGGLVGSVIVAKGSPELSENGKLGIYRSYSTGAVSCVNAAVNMRAGGLIGYIQNSGDSKKISEIQYNFSVSPVISNTGSGFGLVGEYVNSNNLSPGTVFTDNTYDITKTGQVACGKIGAENNTCEGVNADGLSPDYFKSVQNVLTDWSISGVDATWQLSDPYPIFSPIAVRTNPPTNLSVERVDQDFVVTWAAPVGTDGRAQNIKRYDIFYKDVSNGDYSNGWTGSGSADVSEQTKTFSNLTVPAKYVFRVRAVYSDYATSDFHNGLFSPAMQFATGMPSTAPADLAVQTQSKSADVSWGAVEGATGYSVEYRILGSTEWNTYNTSTNELNGTILDLRSSTDYQFRVSATNAAGTGPASSIVNKRTATQSVYTVSNCQQLQDINNDLSGVYTQTADIDCSGISNFAVIGGVAGIFRGNYDGKGFTISNLTISSDVVSETSDWVGVGLFGNTSGSVLQNITIKNSTIVGNYKLSETIDVDQNGLPDAPTIPDVGDGVGLPSYVDDNGDPISCGLNEVSTGDFATCSAIVGGTIAENGSQVGENISPFGGEIAESAINFPLFSVGGIAGVVVGSGTYTNLKVLNTTVQGSVVGSVFGAVIPLPNLSAVPGELQKNNLEKLTASLTLDSLQSSGSVNGFVAGGLVGFGTSSLGSVVGLGGTLTVQNSSSSSIIEANVGGGLMGASMSLSAAALTWTVPKLERADVAPLGTQELLNAINTLFTSQDVIIKNSFATGTVSTCNAPTDERAGILGGIVGLGIGTLVQSSNSKGNISTCSSVPTAALPLYGGFMGGIGGVLAGSRVESSNSTGSIEAIRNTGEYEADAPIYVGMSGGIAGLFVGLENDLNGEAAISDSSSTGSIKVSGNNGLISITGGLNGMFLGEGTIRNSHSTGSITTVAAKENIGAASISGGINGLTLGVDLTWARGNALDWSKIGPTGDGLIVDNSYATGAIVTDKGESGSGMVAVTGGLSGLFLGQGIISNSYATGAVTSNIPENIAVKSVQGDNITILNGIKAQNFGTTVSGGLIGSAYGLDTAGLGSAILVGTGLRSSEQVQFAHGLKITNSYATGEVKGNTVGGLIGSAELKVQINKAYATGNVRGEIVGGLIGQSGLLSTVGDAGMGFGSSVLSGIIANEQISSDNATQIASWFDLGRKALGPVEITNTYNTGSLTAVPYSVDISGTFDEPGFENTIPARLPTVAGGIVGIYMVPGGKVSNSYSSGDITVQSPPDVPRNPKIKIADIPSFAGGIFGVDIAIPFASYRIIFQNIAKGTVLPLSEYASSPTTLNNVFSASKITVSDKTFTGATSGFFVSPINVLHNLLLGGDPKTMTNNKVFGFNGVYADNARLNALSCSGPNKPLTEIATSIWNNSFISDDNGDNLLSTLNIGQNEKTIIDSQVFKSDCSLANGDNSNVNLFKNNSSDGPLAQWDFNSIWKIRKDDYPKFVAGAVTEYPENPVLPPGDPVSDEPGSPVLAISTSPQVPQLYDAARSVAIKQGLINPEIKQVRGLKTLLANVPLFVARSIPYTLILALLVLASLYSWQALRAYAELRTFHKNILRVLDTKEAVENYLAITTHYLNTPVAIMGGAVELLDSLKKISAVQAKSLKKSIKKFADDAAQLLVANQVSGVQANNDELKLKQHQKNPIAAPGVWVPALIAFGLIALANALFIYADVFNTSPYRLAVELGLFLLSAGLVALAYRYRNFLESSKELARDQLKLEAQLYNKRTAFLPQATKVTTDSTHALQLASAPLKSIPEAKLFFNGLAMLTGISTGMSNLEKFANFNAKPPLFDVSSFAKKVVASVSAEAKEKNLTINTEVDAGLVSRIQPEEIKQLVESLLDNAIKFSNKDGVVGLNIYRKFNKLVIIVSDTGTGISEHKLPSLLKPFSRGTDSMEYNHEGLGLGLYSDKVIVDKLGGTIRIESKLGKGTTVTVTVPSRHDAVAFAPVFIAPDVTPA